MLPETIHFTDYQVAFAARIRDPRGAPRPAGAPFRRMRVYEELLFNNLESFLLACYPITRKILGVRVWRKTVRHFFMEQRLHSPLFRDIPKAFLDWIEPRATERFPNLPFLAEFMHYEWLEMAVSIASDEADWTRIAADGDLLDGHPVLEPTARLACYHYPVHRIGPRFKPTEADAGSYCYLLFRDSTDHVHFILLNALSAQLVALIGDRRPSGYEALAELSGKSVAELDDGFVRAANDLLNELRAQGALLGTWRKS